MGPTTTTDPRETLFAMLPPVFRDCVDTDAIRYDLSTPFVQGGHVYATDGGIAVRTPVTPELAAACAAVVEREDPGHPRLANAPRKRPPVDDYFRDLGAFGPAPHPAPDTSSLKVCPQCNGVDQPPATEEDWELFDEEGRCGACHGTHIDGPFDHTFAVGPATLGAVYARVLDRHKATLYLSAADPAGAALWFTAAPGVEGAVMPIKPGMVWREAVGKTEARAR